MIIRPRTATFRYRVGDLAHADDVAGPVGYFYEVREFRTLAAAERYAAELAARGRNALLQVGVLQWMAPDDAAALMEELIAGGTELDGN